MPPTSSVRKGSVAPDSNRRQSGRQARTSTTRPLNYYARPYGSLSGPVDDAQSPDEPPGFFPAITYFADAITALPKEVQRHVSLMKEVEAKVYGPTEALKTLSARIHQLPPPPPRHEETSSQGLLSFTAANSTTASLNGSLINGTAPHLDLRVTDALDGASSEIDEQADLARRSHFRHLRHLISTMIVNLDEKNNVMAEANRVLAQQLSRMDSVMPHVEGEISEDARLGSTTHWAYADNRVKKQTAPANDRARRDVAATSNLAAAAAAVHDNDIAAARGQATRESKKTRGHHADSDFDDKPAPATKRAAPAKARKETAEQKTAGLGITNGASASGIAPTKRRKVEKATAPAMERSASGARKNAAPTNTTPRSTPQAEPVKQKKKPGPAPGFIPVKKRQQQALNSGANSPANASSPVLNTVQPDMSAIRPTSSRVRQNSSTSNLQYSLLAGGEKAQNSRPDSRAEARVTNGANSNGDKPAEKPAAPEAKKTAQNSQNAQNAQAAQNVQEAPEDSNRMQVDQDTPKTERTEALKHEDVHMSDVPSSEQPSRGRQPKVTTPSLPSLDGGTGMLRTRSNRGNASHAHNNQNLTSQHTSTPKAQPAASITSSTRASQSRTPELGSRGHRKSGSGAHILKQIASFNRSPDMDRHRSVPGEPASDISSSDELQNHVRESVRRRDGSRSASGSQSGGNQGIRSSSRRSAQRGISAAVVSATSAPAPASVPAPSATLVGRVSRASRQRAIETEQPRSAQPSRSRNRTPEVADDPGLSADDEVEQEPEEEIEEPAQEMEVERETAVEHVDEEDEEEEEEDPNEPKYCYCGQGSFGEMIACDNDDCTMEWFHLQCTGLRNVPGDNVKWYCDVCKEAMGHTGRGGKKGRPASRHTGH